MVWSVNKIKTAHHVIFKPNQHCQKTKLYYKLFINLKYTMKKTLTLIALTLISLTFSTAPTFAADAGGGYIDISGGNNFEVIDLTVEGEGDYSYEETADLDELKLRIQEKRQQQVSSQDQTNTDTQVVVNRPVVSYNSNKRLPDAGPAEVIYISLALGLAGYVVLRKKISA